MRDVRNMSCFLLGGYTNHNNARPSALRSIELLGEKMSELFGLHIMVLFISQTCLNFHSPIVVKFFLRVQIPIFQHPLPSLHLGEVLLGCRRDEPRFHGKKHHSKAILGGGNSNIFYFHPIWERFTAWLIFSGWVGKNHQLVYLKTLTWTFGLPPTIGPKVSADHPPWKRTFWPPEHWWVGKDDWFISCSKWSLFQGTNSWIFRGVISSEQPKSKPRQPSSLMVYRVVRFFSSERREDFFCCIPSWMCRISIHSLDIQIPPAKVLCFWGPNTFLGDVWTSRDYERWVMNTWWLMVDSRYSR